LDEFSEAEQKNSRLEEEKKANTKHITDLEYALSAQDELHKSEVNKAREET
jgi:hypothetical protein